MIFPTVFSSSLEWFAFLGSNSAGLYVHGGVSMAYSLENNGQRAFHRNESFKKILKRLLIVILLGCVGLCCKTKRFII